MVIEEEEQLELLIRRRQHYIDFADLVDPGKDGYLRYSCYKSVDLDFEPGYLSLRAVV